MQLHNHDAPGRLAEAICLMAGLAIDYSYYYRGRSELVARPAGPRLRLATFGGAEVSAKEPGEHGLASDALAAAISDGRVTGAKLAPTLAKLLTTAGIKPGRWAKVFADVARVSPLHLHVVRQILEETLVAAGKDLAKVPKDLHHILELLLELLAESSEAIASQPLRGLLEKFPSGGKAAKAAKSLLAAQAGENAFHREAVMQTALRQRIERAQRWQGQCSAAR